jgi:hypothetical protein
VKRRTLVLVAVFALAASGALAGWLASGSSAGATGLCASAPTGLKERSFPKGRYEAAIELSNFRFGGVNDFYGIGASAGRTWPSGGITIVVVNEGPSASPPVRSALRVRAADFGGFEGSPWPTAHVAVRSKGRFLEAYAEVRTVTPPAVATVNRALAHVRACRA